VTDDARSLDQQYDAYERIEEEFWAALDESLDPRGPEVIYDVVAALGLPPGATVVDVGCGSGRHALPLAERFGFTVHGFDAVARHVELAEEALAGRPDLQARVRFERGFAEALPLADASVDLVWSHDVLGLVEDLDAVYRELRRVLRDSGRAVTYQSMIVDRPLDADEIERIRRFGGAVDNTDAARIDAAITAGGFRIVERHDVGAEWGEWSEEQTGKKGRALRHLARLRRRPERYIERFGRAAYDIMLGDCYWHVDHLTGRYKGHLDVLEVDR
jgi:SAM-dependent methyltransferase